MSLWYYYYMKKFILILFVLIIIVIAVVSLSGLFKSGGASNIIPNQAPKTSTSDQKSSTSTSTQTPVAKRPASDGQPDQASVPAVKSLMAKSWQWVSTTESNGTKLVPTNASKFSLSFATDGVFSSTTDCNSVNGKYTVKGDTILFSNMMSTKMFCSGSQETNYTQILENAQTFKILPDGTLRIDLKFGSGYAIFK